ncbi:hypothetical protein E2562_018118 [Oryza meyeriana var. granulata]|uniref:glycerophosphodiester phosphodiesterase n=1 Tax=Oryza meyeriana var. granulata TaxID=110450 RepID=A0A6G1C6X1_9ORYZ|nr:hypothetical protein E2562_018118 [Oryza meyeriana var. granulata]
MDVTQAIWSRTDKFDFAYLPILPVTNVTSLAKPSSVWLNIEHDIFYRQHGFDMTKYILSTSRSADVKYISSCELGFLQGISGRVNRNTKLVFRFLDAASSDPSSNQTYGSLLSNLTFIKTVASGIMVPKEYIWPVTANNYIQPPKSVVRDAHNAGLEIYASDFANDRVIPYNYSYDPLEEYLHFVGSDNFSVDGVLTEHPLTAAAAIGCFTNLNVSSKTDHGSPLIISHNGASGDYPDCTDLAYQKAVDDGADVIDCSIQITNDGVPICMSSINLFDTTNVQRTTFSNRASIIKDIQTTPGIFTFNLSWAEISNSDLRLAACTHALLLAVNSCTGLGDSMPPYMTPARIGALAQLLNGSQAQPPALAPMPVLNSSDVTEPPLPPVVPKNAPGGGANGSTSAPVSDHSGGNVLTSGLRVVLTCVDGEHLTGDAAASGEADRQGREAEESGTF